ncbi:IS3 family transposase, partial [Tenacibaculum maritimum]|uniref:IS3 family transposase n=1 Tax=Tenacibaculum maritimum TaxID=107401 RepID=UPI003875DD99
YFVAIIQIYYLWTQLIRLNKCRHSRQRLGAKKLYHILKQDIQNNGIKMGRDKFYSFLKTHRLLVPRTKNYHITTNSKHHFYKYKNLVSNKVPTRAEQLWVTDITYIKTQKGHNYLALVTDAYSKQIMGYKLDNHMRTSLCTNALEMAIKNRKYPNQKLIHHSDRGLQYCNQTYTSFAESNGLIMSMTEKYDPYENPIAERINRTLKYEYGLKLNIKNTKLAQKIAKRAVMIYNNMRPHFSLDLYTPKHVHLNQNIEYKSYRKNKNNLELLTF